MSDIQQFLKDHAITEVEAIVPDMAGVARGKIMPAAKYAEDEGMRRQAGSPENLEAVRAFLEKRPPDFRKLRGA